MKKLFSRIISILLFALALRWYDYLWLPQIKIAYWTQLVPISAAIWFLLAILKKSPMRWLLQLPFTLLFIGSILLQTLVWISLVRLPLF